MQFHASMDGSFRYIVVNKNDGVSPCTLVFILCIFCVSPFDKRYKVSKLIEKCFAYFVEFVTRQALLLIWFGDEINLRKICQILIVVENIIY